GRGRRAVQSAPGGVVARPPLRGRHPPAPPPPPPPAGPAFVLPARRPPARDPPPPHLRRHHSVRADPAAGAARPLVRAGACDRPAAQALWWVKDTRHDRR